MITLSHHTHTILALIESRGYEAFVVGGFVRDAFLGIQSKDIDITTNCPYEHLVTLFKDRAPVLNDRYGSLSFNMGDESFEITQYRSESQYSDKRHPDTIAYLDSVYEEGKRRDFTMNALLYHPKTGLIDPFHGLDDLNNGVLRVIGDPYQRFVEDPLRIVRLFRFMAVYDFKADSLTLHQALKAMPSLEGYRKQWLKTELFKMLMGKAFASVSLQHPECLSTIIPELNKARDFNQNNPFHLYSLYEHTIRVIAGVETLELKLCALFHDLGKLNTRIHQGNRSRYPGHAQASSDIAKTYFERWQLHSKKRHHILRLIALHDLDLGDSLHEMAQMVAQYGYEFVCELVNFKRADNRAKSEMAQYQLTRCDQYEKDLAAIAAMKVFSIRDLAINGTLLKNLGITAHKRKEVLNHLLISVMSGRVQNTDVALVEEMRRHDHDLY